MVYGLVKEGIKPLILNRTPERAEKLARTFGCTYSGINARGYALMRKYSDLIVQTTSVGMERIWNIAASSDSSSVLHDAKTAPGCLSEASSKIGLKV